METILRRLTFKSCLCYHSNSRFFNRQHILLVWWTGVSTDDLYSYVYELYSTTRQFVSMCLWGRLPSRAPKNKDRKSAHAFNSSFRYIDDVLSPNSSRFCHYSYPIYTIKLEVNDTTDIQKFASCLDLHIEIDNGGRLNTTLYDKRYDFTFPIVNFPFISSNIPASLAYGVYISEFVRFHRTCDQQSFSG